jgi:hypothetical protein
MGSTHNAPWGKTRFSVEEFPSNPGPRTRVTSAPAVNLEVRKEEA